LVDVDEHRGLEERPGSGRLAADHRAGTGGDRLVDVPLHDVAWCTGRQWPNVERELALVVALPKQPDLVGELGHELVINRRLDVHPLHRDACLA
jgi:hypothetical protein